MEEDFANKFFIKLAPCSYYTELLANYTKVHRNK